MTPPDSLDSFHAVIPAGGAGTRLWPLSRAGRPKFLLDLDGSGRSLLQQTWDRLRELVPAERIHVVTGAAHADAICEQLPELTGLLVEPSPRDSMPAIGLAAAVIGASDPDAIIGSFAADHVIEGQEAFAAAITQAVAVAGTGLITTIGIAPTGPSTAFGYIESGRQLDVPGAPSAQAVAAFVEKPDAETAAAYVAGGAHSWNGGMFVTRTDVLLGHLARLQPGLHQGLAEIARAWGGDRQQDVLEATWPRLTKIAIDHAVAEPVSLEGGMAVVPGTFGWDDVGDFAALQDVGTGSSPDTVWVDASGLAIAADHTTIAVVGLVDVVVVRTADALLVTTRAHAQRVKDVVAELKERGRTDLV
ncbi:mannose-1-phosphate guanylyltransferase [Aeromicrobium sp. S22]|uniref:mannose-1-phosphate guanylyltransferase n=1 Tax=Aeromicrobium sp. S22 TaxID=2662029 RepID=UPI00129ED6F7|nr:mannose-1-phosphate guanylyltransferase [Aeromicrobium sp. S22]MRK02767.1 mannose-1-phosphate guanylyltransferase [Aeromicrobium sp. S22]